MWHDSDEEDISQPPARRRPSSQETIPGAGRPLGDVDDYRDLNQTMADDAWNPFSSEADFNLASWFVRNKIGKSQSEVYFAEGLAGTYSRSFQSTYTLRQHPDILELFCNYMVWTEAEINDGRHVTTFNYQNVFNCICYLICQVAYRSNMVSEPIQEYNSTRE